MKLIEMLAENLTANSRNIRSWADHNSPAILLVTGIAGFCVAGYGLVKHTPKAHAELEELRERRAELQTTKASDILEDTGVILRNYWKDFLLAAGSGVSLIVGYKVQNNRLAAATALSASYLEYIDIYKRNVKNELGEKKAAKIEEKVVKEIVNEDSEGAREVIITKPGEMLCKDAHTGRYFATSKEAILKAENELNRRIFVEMFISLNEFYDELGISHVKMGDDIGWTTDIPPRFSMEYAELAEDGRPCCLIDYDIELRTAPWL